MFEPLSLDQLSVAHFFVFFLLELHNGELGLFKNFHAGLLERLKAQDIKHGLNFFVKVK